MGTATGFTAARMKEIEDTTVVGGQVVDGELQLVTREGEVIPAGDVRGPAAENRTQFYTLAVPSIRWTLPHGFNDYGVTVETWDASGRKIIGKVDTSSDPDVAYVDWYALMPVSGTARVSN